MSQTFAVTLENFEPDVMQASAEKPVVITFTSAQFPESFTAAETLERLSAELQFSLGKVDLDSPENRQFIQVFRIAALPDTRVIAEGKIAEVLNGNLSEAEFKDRLKPFFMSPEEQAKFEVIRLMESGSPENALPRAEALIAQNPEDKSLLLLLARVYIRLSRIDEAKTVLSRFSEKETEYREAKSLLELMDFHVESLKTDVQGTEETLYHKACVFAVRENYREAFDAFLELLQMNAEWNGGAAKNAMLTLFGVLGPKHALTWEYRAKLNRILFI
ncbi:MAG: tetratricopeptide repeat protein [Fibrobacter sp.]|jgi:putative thioredoxin|nr:tetratricopeptide repeat protein [Fibrobacter sp.]